MKYHAIYRIPFFILLTLIFLPRNLYAESLTLSGKQIRHGDRFSSKLESEPILISEKSEIIHVKGGQKGFWINKKDGYKIENACKFWNTDDAIGQVLEPGIYTIYPNLVKGEQSTQVAIEVEYFKKAYNIPIQSSSLEQYRYTKNNFFRKIFQTTGKEKIELCKKSIQGFHMVINEYDDPKANTTKMLAAYNQARCYLMLGDMENSRRSLRKCLQLTPDIEDQNESTISYSWSIYRLAQRELKKLEAKDQ